MADDIPAGKAKKNPKVYGAGLEPYGIYLLAEAYHVAGDLLRANDDRQSFSNHPTRLLYFQALENYLRAFLRLRGKNAEELRAYMHNFTSMIDDCKSEALCLTPNGEAYIRRAAEHGDYVRIRYDYHLRSHEPDGTGRKDLSIKYLVKAVADLEKAVHAALEAAGIQHVRQPAAKMTRLRK